MLKINKLAYETDIVWLKETYFSDPKYRLTLKKGEELMRQGELNERLYLILTGKLTGFLVDDDGEAFEVFRSEKGMFVGVYSFFSQTWKSYATITAYQDTELAYIDRQHPALHKETIGGFAAHFMPILVQELSARQLTSYQVAMDRQQALKKLMQADSMATLGQLAAGLTHELNNAISVLQHKTEWMAQKIDGYLKEKDMHKRHAYFKMGCNLGQQLSSSEIRQARKQLSEKHGFSHQDSRLIARMNLTEEELENMRKEEGEGIKRAFNYWEIGTAFYDLGIAAKHATHVVRSVKKLAVSQSEVVDHIDVNQTIRESITLLKSKLRHVDINLRLGELPTVSASEGDLVQIWLNLVKNACESLLQAGTPGPQVIVESNKDGGFIVVSITDNGPGIPKSMQRKVFQPNVTTKIGGLSFGLGLGLSIVKRLVHNYDGTITLQSAAGKTVFTVFLPINN